MVSEPFVNSLQQLKYVHRPEFAGATAQLQLMNSARVYEAVVFGASGFTGQRVLRELVSHDRG